MGLPELADRLDQTCHWALQLSRWELAATLSHPHLIRLFDFGRCRLDNIGLLYVVMEYAEENLSHVLPHRPLTGAEAYEMLDAVLDVLAYLHRKGFAHSHLKPANIMGVGDQLKISTDGVNLSKSERGPVILGVYDPPELATRGASPAADVWSLGATLVEALTQGLPGFKETQEDPGLPDTVPAPFLEIARHCLRRDPERRWTVAEITARLRQIAPAAQEQLSASPPPAFAKHRYIVPAAAVGLALAAMVAGPLLFDEPLPSHSTSPGLNSKGSARQLNLKRGIRRREPAMKNKVCLARLQPLRRFDPKQSRQRPRAVLLRERS